MFLSSIGYPEESRPRCLAARLAGRDGHAHPAMDFPSNLAAEGQPTDKFVRQPPIREEGRLGRDCLKVKRGSRVAVIELCRARASDVPHKDADHIRATFLSLSTPPLHSNPGDVESRRPQSVSFIAAYPRRGVSGVVSPSGETRRFPLLSIRQN